MIICYSKGLEALNILARHHNHGKKPREHVIKNGHVHTWRAILKVASRSVPASWTPDTPLTIRTSNRELAQLSGASDRTVLRHRKVLKELGLIVAEEYRGNNHPYVLHLAPEYLGVGLPVSGPKVTSALDKVWQAAMAHEANLRESGPSAPSSAVIPDFTTLSGSPEGDKLSPLTEEKKDNKDNKGAHVDKADPSPLQRSPDQLQQLEHPSQGPQSGLPDGEAQQNNDGNENGNPRAWTPSHAGSDSIRAKGKEKGTGGRGGASLRNSAATNADPRDLANYASLLIHGLWLMASRLLWPDQVFTDTRIKRSKAQIAEWYRPFVLKGEGALDECHDLYTRMVREAHRYVSKPRKRPTEKRRFIPPPEGWFDISNDNGFRGTYRWAMLSEARIKQNAGDLALKRELQKFRKNLHEYPSRQRPHLQLYLECQDRLRKYNRPELLDSFNAFVLSGIPEEIGSIIISHGYGQSQTA